MTRNADRLSRVSIFAAIVAVLTLAVPVATQRGPRPRGSATIINGRQAAADEVLVKYRAGTRDDERQQINQQVDADEDHEVGSVGVRRVHSRFYDADALVSFLRADPRVQYAEPNYIVSAVATPNDPQFGNLWGLKNLAQTIACGGACYGGATGTAGADIHATDAWDISTGSTTNVVGVVDTGVDYTHPDLAANVWSAPAAFSVTIAGKTTTCAAGTHGFRSISLGKMSCDPMDDNNHGSHVSGTIGGRGNNGVGVVGVNWTASIMGLKFLSSSGSGYTSDAINVMEFAMKAKALFGGSANVRVLSNSWGGGGFSQALLDEINKANTNDMLFVAAAGNSGTNNDTTPFYPANYAAPNVVAVAATTNQDVLTSFSDYGPTTVHLGAPGQDILSTTRNNTYSYFSGTSMATPHVSGAAALLLSACTLNTAALKSTLIANVDTTLPGWVVSNGRLNVDKAIRACSGSGSGPSPDFSIGAAPASQSVVQGAGTSYGVTLTASNGWSSTVDLTASGLPSGAGAAFSPSSLTSGASTMAVTTAANTPTGSYTITITGKGPGGTPTHAATVTLAVTPAPNVTLSASPSSRSIRRGRSTTYQVSIARVGGFASPLTLSVSGLGSGATGSFSPNPAGGTASTLTITTKSNATRGTFHLTITGTDGGLTRTASVTLTVN